MTTAYVAAAYVRAPEVRAIHAELRAAGVECLSTWADEATGLDDFTDPKVVTRAYAANRLGCTRVDALIVLPEGGRETFGEVARFVDYQPNRNNEGRLLWVGPARLTLSAAFADACGLMVRCVDIADAVRVVRDWGGRLPNATPNATEEERCAIAAGEDAGGVVAP